MKLNDKTKSRIHLVLDVAVSAMLCVTGILFISACYTIYKSGVSPFTRESIGEAFSRIAFFVYLTLGVLVAGCIVNVLIPKETPKLKGHRTPEVQIKALAEKVDLSKIDTEIADKIMRERRTRTALARVRTLILTLSLILPLFYFLNPNNFPAVSGEYNSEILHGMLLYLVFLAPATAYEIFYVLFTDSSYVREQGMLKEAIKLIGRSDVSVGEVKTVSGTVKGFFKENKKPILLGVRIALVGCALVFVVLGVANGGMSDVLNKAIKICTECIGLG